MEDSWKNHIENALASLDYSNQTKNLDTLLGIIDLKLWELVPRIKRVQDMENFRGPPTRI